MAFTLIPSKCRNKWKLKWSTRTSRTWSMSKRRISRRRGTSTIIRVETIFLFQSKKFSLNTTRKHRSTYKMSWWTQRNSTRCLSIRRWTSLRINWASTGKHQKITRHSLLEAWKKVIAAHQCIKCKCSLARNYRLWKGASWMQTLLFTNPKWRGVTSRARLPSTHPSW